MPLVTAGLPLMKSVLTAFAKSVLVAWRLTAAAAATNAAIQNKFFESSVAALIVSNKETEDIVKIVKSLKNLVY